MPKELQKDNSTLVRKVSLRKLALRLLNGEEETPAGSRAQLAAQSIGAQPASGLGIIPVVMETHGGYGMIYLECYRHIRNGVVFETDEYKAGVLSDQRPTWRVYQNDCVQALRAGVAGDMAVNLLDCDPYGEPWPVLDAYFTSPRIFPERMVVVVNDGLRGALKSSRGWAVGSMAEVVAEWGNERLYDDYLGVSKELLKRKAHQAGYDLVRFAGYYCGHADAVTHYLGLLVRRPHAVAD